MRAGKIPCCSHCVLTVLSLLSEYVNGVLTMTPPSLCFDHDTSMQRCRRRPHYVVNTFFRCLTLLWHVWSSFSQRLWRVLRIKYKYLIQFPPSLHFNPAMDINAHNQELLQQLALLQGQQALLDAQAALVLMKRRRRRNSCMLYLIVVKCKCGHSKTPRMNEIAWHMAQYL